MSNERMNLEQKSWFLPMLLKDSGSLPNSNHYFYIFLPWFFLNENHGEYRHIYYKNLQGYCHRSAVPIPSYPVLGPALPWRHFRKIHAIHAFPEPSLLEKNGPRFFLDDFWIKFGDYNIMMSSAGQVFLISTPRLLPMLHCFFTIENHSVLKSTKCWDH